MTLNAGRICKTIGSKLWLALMAVVMAVNVGCERKDLFLRVDQIDINIAIYDIQLSLLWQVDWESRLGYKWLPEFGDLGYPPDPELVKATVYDADAQTAKRKYSFFKIFNSKGGRVSLNAGSTYDMLFYNFGTEWITFYEDENYEYYNASTRASMQAPWFHTKAEGKYYSEMPATTRSYTDYNQPDILFGKLVPKIFVSEDPSVYTKEVDEDGNVSYIYKIDATLEPYTYIYIFQFVVVNNEDDKGQIVKGARGITVTGLSQGVEMFTRKTFETPISITTEDIKPTQHFDSFKIPELPDDPVAAVFAARIVTWGLPGINPLEVRMNNQQADYVDDNYIGIGLLLRNNNIYTITCDISKVMHECPTGGVITLVIDGGMVPKNYLDPVEPSGGGGFNAKVKDWDDEVNAHVTI